MLLLSNVKSVLMFNNELLTSYLCTYIHIHINIYLYIEITREKHDKYMFMNKQETFKDNRVGPKISSSFTKVSRP